MSRMLSKDRLTFALLAIILVMGVEIVYLIWQNRKLESMLDDPLQYLQTLQPDQTVPAIRGQDITGAEFGLQYDAAQPYTLLTWFSAGCGACKANFEYWNGMRADFPVEQVRMVGFCAGTLEDARQMQAEHAIVYPVVSVTDQFLVDAYKGNLLPQTILISPEGRVKQVWPGELLLAHREQIETTLAGLVSHAMKGGDSE